MGNRQLAFLQIFTAAGIAVFWILFFAVGLMPENPSPCFLCYEHAFPVPDLVLAATLMAAAILLLKAHPLGHLLTQAAGGALIFLGLLDISFNLQNAIYSSSMGDLIMNALINGWCVFFGTAQFVMLRRTK